MTALSIGLMTFLFIIVCQQAGRKMAIFSVVLVLIGALLITIGCSLLVTIAASL